MQRRHMALHLEGLNHDAFAGLIVVALADAQVAAIGLRETVVPTWPPSRRIFPNHLARRLEDGRSFDESFVEDLNTFLGKLAMKIAASTHFDWEADEHHIRGSLEVVRKDEEPQALTPCGPICAGRGTPSVPRPAQLGPSVPSKNCSALDRRDAPLRDAP